MSKSNIKILLTLLAVAIVGLVYLYVFNPNMEDKKSIEAENETLQTKLDDLLDKQKYRDQYEKETQEYYAAFDEILAYYPANLDQELSVMFMKGIEDAHPDKFDISTVGLGAPTEFYTIGSTDDGYVCYEAAFPITYTGTYQSIKDVLDYVAEYKYRMNVSSVNIAYDTENDVATGAISMNAYFIAGGDREKDTVNIDVNEGVENLFMGGADAAATGQSYAYDADNGASIASNNDIKMTLTNANNDSGAGIVVSGTGAEEVTSTENKEVTVTVRIYKDGDKTYAAYKIGDDEKTMEVKSADLKIYVASSERVDADDNNGVKLVVNNETDMNVFVKVADDDAKTPRFKKGSSNGTVKVY